MAWQKARQHTICNRQCREAIAKGAGAALDAPARAFKLCSADARQMHNDEQQPSSTLNSDRDLVLQYACEPTVLHAAFAMLASCFGRQRAFHKWLLQWCAPAFVLFTCTEVVHCS